MRVVAFLLIAAFSVPMAAQLRPGSPQPVSTFLSEEAFERLILARTNPVYPDAALQQQIQGDVVLNVELTTRGTLQQIKVMKGPAELRQAAMDTVKQWRFRPYLQGVDPVAVGGQVVVSFSINGNIRPHVEYR